MEGEALLFVAPWCDPGWELWLSQNWYFSGGQDTLRGHAHLLQLRLCLPFTLTHPCQAAPHLSQVYMWGNWGPRELLRGCVPVKTAPPEVWLMLNTSKQTSKCRQRPLFQGRVFSQAGVRTWPRVGGNQPSSLKSTCMYSKVNDPPNPDLVSHWSSDPLSPLLQVPVPTA